MARRRCIHWLDPLHRRLFGCQGDSTARVYRHVDTKLCAAICLCQDTLINNHSPLSIIFFYSYLIIINTTLLVSNNVAELRDIARITRSSNPFINSIKRRLPSPRYYSGGKFEKHQTYYYGFL